MKAITEKEKLPKFLIVNGVPETQSYNKHLLKPWKKGELVKVAPFEEQVRNDKYDDQLKYVKPDNNPLHFRQKYVKVIRKDDNGEWTLTYIAGWEYFDMLKLIKRTKNENQEIYFEPHL